MGKIIKVEKEKRNEWKRGKEVKEEKNEFLGDKKSVRKRSYK